METSIESPQSNPPVLAYATDGPPQNVVIWCRLLAIVLLAVGVERIAGELSYFLYEMSARSRASGIYFVISLISSCFWLLLAWYWLHSDFSESKDGVAESAGFQELNQQFKWRETPNLRHSEGSGRFKASQMLPVHR